MQISDLAEEVVETFGFLGTPTETELVDPERFKGGFILRYENLVTLQYLDWEFYVTSDRELFGDTNKNGFAGNMFSPEHLHDCLPRIAEYVRVQLRATGATGTSGQA